MLNLPTLIVSLGPAPLNVILNLLQVKDSRQSPNVKLGGMTLAVRP
jgi:hypothetical protein